MIKRFLWAALIVLSIVTLAGTASASGYSGYTGEGFIANDVTAEAGETFEVYLEAGRMRNFSSVRFSVQFDDTVLILKGVELNPDGVIPGYFMRSEKLENPCAINWIHTGIFEGYANFAKLTFAVAEDAYSGDYWIRFDTYSEDTLAFTNGGELVKNENGAFAVSKVTVEGRSYTPVSSVVIDQTSLKLKKGESKTLKAKILPSDALALMVIWSSGDESVAKVSQSGKVTAVSDGVAIIYATTGGITGECRVVVETPHSCSFTEKVIDHRYLHREATCEEPAQYYYICLCGEIGTKAFSYGGVLPHSFDGEGVCTQCGRQAHRCSYSVAWKSDAGGHWRGCDCGEQAAWSVHLDENRDGKCDVCRYIQEKTGVTVSGTVNAGNAVTKISLLPEGEAAEVCATELSAEATGYLLENIAPGSYILRAVRQGNVTREYSLLISDGDVKQNILLCLPGDANTDGRVNIVDAARLYAHVRGVTLLPDAYSKECANVTGGSLNILDCAVLYSQIRTP
jgi:hypothetical protein